MSNIAKITYEGKKFDIEYYSEAEASVITKLGTFRERPILEWIRKLGKTGVYVDCGAHVGNHTFYFSTFCNPSMVFAYEAHPKIFDILRRNRDRFGDPGNVILINSVVWSSSGMTVSLSDIPRNNAGHTHVVKSGSTKAGTVHLDSVSMLYGENGVDIIKIDVEDTEMEVLKGAAQLISKRKPVIVAERHSKNQFDECNNFLKSFGYKNVASWGGVHTYAWSV